MTTSNVDQAETSVKTHYEATSDLRRNAVAETSSELQMYEGTV